MHPETNQIQAADRGKGFTFDKVIPEDADHTAVYDTVRPLVQKLMDGYNATILAYGQVCLCRVCACLCPCHGARHCECVRRLCGVGGGSALGRARLRIHAHALLSRTHASHHVLCSDKCPRKTPRTT